MNYIDKNIGSSKMKEQPSKPLVFKMKDKTGNTYLLEWRNGKAEVISHNNKQGMNESIDRMKQLMGYKSSDYFNGTSVNERLNEDNEGFTNTLDKARKIIK